MGFSEIGFAYLMSTIPITKIDDMRNQKAWSPDTNYVAQIALEAFPVARIPLAIGDVLMGLQTGMVDIVPGSPVAALALQWHTKLKFITELPLSYVYGVMVIDSRAFKKMSQSDQQIVRDVMGKAMDEIGKLNRKDNSGAMNALKNQGVEFIKPNQEEAAEIRRIMEGANEKFIHSGKISERMVEQFDQYLKDSRSR
ncbi:MAG: TRAP transporter substrate-binding protein DctP, partial [Gammaproteobacteria bacterium]